MTNKIIVPNVILLSEVARILKEGRSVTLRTKGNSMLPFIRGEKDSVILTGAFQPQKGDIILGKTEKGDFVLHRIIRMNTETVVLMGDGNLKGTEICRKEEILGKVVFILQNGKRINPYSYRYRYLWTLWLFLLPVRKYLLGVYRRMYK